MALASLFCRKHVPIDDLPKLVREGPLPPTPEADMASGEIWTQYAAAMANAERAGIARQAPEIISGLPEFPSLMKMLDLGGVRGSSELQS